MTSLKIKTITFPLTGIEEQKVNLWIHDKDVEYFNCFTSGEQITFVFLYKQATAEIPERYSGMLNEIKETSDILKGILDAPDKKNVDDLLGDLQKVRERLDEDKECC